jgi:hypothetical protein
VCVCVCVCMCVPESVSRAKGPLLANTVSTFPVSVMQRYTVSQCC